MGEGIAIYRSDANLLVGLVQIDCQNKRTHFLEFAGVDSYVSFK